MKTLPLAALAASLLTLGGCTVSHDRYGNPNGVGILFATTEEPTDFEKGVGIAESVGWLIDPKLGMLATLIGGAALGKRQQRQANDLADARWDEATAFAMARQAQPVGGPTANG